MCNMALNRAIEVALAVKDATDDELQEAHNTFNVRCAEVQAGLVTKLEGLSLPVAKKYKLMRADELELRNVTHKAPRPARLAAAMMATS